MAGEVVQPVGTGVVTCLGEMRAPVANPFDYGSLDTEQADAARSAAQRIKTRMRDTALLSPKITRAHQAFLATLGEHGPPTEAQLVKLEHIGRLVT